MNSSLPPVLTWQPLYDYMEQGGYYLEMAILMLLSHYILSHYFKRENSCLIVSLAIQLDLYIKL